MTDRVKLKKSRMMRYFIDATNCIIKEEGLGGLSIRSVADRAGYSSATLYNYFENLSHLIFLASLDKLKRYNKAAAKIASSCSNSLEIYAKVCECFCLYCYESPEIFNILFFEHNQDKFDAYIAEYYSLFPDELDGLPEHLRNLLHSSSLHSRSLRLLQACIDDGYISGSEIQSFNDICLRFNKTILDDVISKSLTPSAATTLTLRYYHQMLGYIVLDKHKSLLDGYFRALIKG